RKKSVSRGTNTRTRLWLASLLVAVVGTAFIVSGCGCRDYTDCELQDDGDYECYPPTCEDAEESAP
ncbi:MAG: hypothetical protein P8R45_11155, partial [Candidatus Binatia bacterium]|nr:hypothetical protein [Candidatus Binatia bacterium]